MPAIANATAAVVLPTLAAITATSSITTAAAAAAAAAGTTTATLSSSLQAILSVVNASAAIALSPLQRRLQTDPDSDAGDGGGGVGDASTATVDVPPHHANVASIILSNFLPTSYTTVSDDDNTIDQHHQHQHHLQRQPLQYETNHENLGSAAAIAPSFPTFSPPSIESLVASSAEDLSNFRDVTFDIFDDDDELFGSPLAFDASENGLWNGRFVPPPPRPPFFVDEPVLSDGLTTCDLCSWAMPTKSTFIFEGTIEKASELGWPLTLIIVSILSALVGAIVMITVVRCRRKKASNNRNETHVQWWSRHKRPNGSNSSASSNNNNNHLRRSNIYTAHPADSIRGGCGMMLGQPSLSAASSLTAMTAMGVSVAAAAPLPATVSAGNGSPNGMGGGMVTPALTPQQAAMPPPPPPQYYHTYGHHQAAHQQQQQQQPPLYHHTAHHHHSHHANHNHNHHHPLPHEYEHEYHQPQELHLAPRHQRQHSASLSSETSSPTLSGAINGGAMLPVQMHAPQRTAGSSVSNGGGVGVGEEAACRWPSSTLMVAS